MLKRTDTGLRRAQRVAWGAVIGSGLLFLAAAPYATTSLPLLPSFVYSHQSALVLCDAIIALLLFGQFLALRSRSLFVLATGFVFAAFMAMADALTFPGILAPARPGASGQHGTDWMYVLWHAGFPIFVIVYALLCDDRDSARPHDRTTRRDRRDRAAIAIGVATTLVIVCGLTAVATAQGSLLPAPIDDTRHMTTINRAIAVSGLLCLVALVLVWKRQQPTVLDLWLRAVMSVSLLEMVLSGPLSGARFDLGWYAGRIFGLLAAGLMLSSLLVESLRHHALLVDRSRELSTTNADLEKHVATRTAELLLALDAATASNRAKSAFLATMSHEIRTPMNGVIGMVEVLHHSQLPEQHAQAVRTVRTAAFILLGIIDNILDFSKIEAGRLDLERAVVSLPELIESTCITLLPLAKEKDVEINLFIEPSVPTRIWSDTVRLHQVLSNLASNAIKFSAGTPVRRGRVSIRVEMAAGPPPRLLLRVRDNGIGMDPDVQSRLFVPFMQAETSTTRRFGGTGLGLSITKRLLTLMGGQIEVATRIAEGSTFTVSLPIEIVDGDRSPERFDLAGVECVIVGLGDKTGDMRVYLEHAGALVSHAVDIAEAVGRASKLMRAIVIQAGWRDTQSTALLRAAFASVPGVRHVLVTRGRRWDVMQPSSDVVTIDGNCLRRAELLAAVAVAADRAAPGTANVIDPLDSGRFTQEPLSPGEARHQGRLILIAEDDVVNQLVVRRQIEMLGYAADIAGDGAEALRLWRAGDYPLLLTDLHMPEMDGYALAAAIRDEEASRGQDETRMPILAFTANALIGEAIRAKSVGIDEYLTKPLRLEALETALRRWLPLDRPDTVAAELYDEAIPSR